MAYVERLDLDEVRAWLRRIARPDDGRYERLDELAQRYSG